MAKIKKCLCDVCVGRTWIFHAKLHRHKNHTLTIPQRITASLIEIFQFFSAINTISSKEIINRNSTLKQLQWSQILGSVFLFIFGSTVCTEHIVRFIAWKRSKYINYENYYISRKLSLKLWKNPSKLSWITTEILSNLKLHDISTNASFRILAYAWCIDR